MHERAAADTNSRGGREGREEREGRERLTALLYQTVTMGLKGWSG